MIMSKASRTLIISSLYAISHIAGCSFITFDARIQPGSTDVRRCHTCLLQEVGTTRLVLTHIRDTDERGGLTYTFSAAPSEFFYRNLVTFCSRAQLCGRIKIIKNAAPRLEPPNLPTKQFQAQYMCLIQSKQHHRLSCRKCYMQKSNSVMVGDFILQHPDYRQAVHLYVLYTTEGEDVIVERCKSNIVCSGITGTLAAEACLSFVGNLPVKDNEHLPKSDVLNVPIATIPGIRDHESKNHREFLKVLTSFTEKVTMKKHCFKTKTSSGSTSTCSNCIVKHVKALILNMGQQIDSDIQASQAMEGEFLPLVNYIYTESGINWKFLDASCRASCGQIKTEEDDRNCLTSFNSHFDSRTQDLPIGTQLLSAPSSMHPSFCIWIMSGKLGTCITDTETLKVMWLSRATSLLLMSDLTLLKCIDQLLFFREVPNAICEYEMTVKTARSRTTDFDLNKAPRRQRILGKTRFDQSDYTQNAVSYSPFFYNNVKVIHLKQKEEAEMVNCVKCLCQYEEVLLISVTHAYLWLTMKKGGISGMLVCNLECSIDISYPAASYHFHDFQSLQPITVEEVVSVFYGEGKKA